jgi:hypothetical protein
MANASNVTALMRFASKGVEEDALIPTDAANVAPPSNSRERREI